MGCFCWCRRMSLSDTNSRMRPTAGASARTRITRTCSHLTGSLPGVHGRVCRLGDSSAVTASTYGRAPGHAAHRRRLRAELNPCTYRIFDRNLAGPGRRAMRYPARPAARRAGRGNRCRAWHTRRANEPGPEYAGAYYPNAREPIIPFCTAESPTAERILGEQNGRSCAVTTAALATQVAEHSGSARVLLELLDHSM